MPLLVPRWQGVEQLGKSRMFEDPRKTASGQQAASLDYAKPAPAPLPAGWRQATDPKSGRPYYISPERETTWVRPLTEAAAAARRLFQERGIETLPTTQLWRAGELLQEIGSMSLEGALVQLGAKPVTGRGARFATGNERLKDQRFSDKGNGLPSATAVDDIDFTGGKAGYGGTAFNTKWNDRGKTTGDYLPDLRDKPGDNMGNDGYPDPFGDRDDLPPGGTGRPPPRQ